MMSDPLVHVECDGENCDDYIAIGMTLIGGQRDPSWDLRDATAAIERQGWTVVDDDTHLCEDCADPED